MSRESEQFLSRIEGLVTQFEAQVDGKEWVTRRYPKRLRDELGELYEVPALYVQKGPTILLLDPVGYDIPGAEGAADIYQMPAYDPAATLYFENGRWMIHHDFPPDPTKTGHMIDTEASPLDAQTINWTLDKIAEHAIPSI